MARSRREARGQVDIWPGFVDALSTLLMAIIFLLVVFVLAQFLMSRMLEGRNADLGRLQSEVRDLSSRLELEQDGTAELRRNLARLNADLATALGERDDLSAELRQSEAARDQAAERLTLMSDEQRLLQRTLDEMRLGREDALRQTTSLRAELDEARQVVAADRQKIEVQLAQLVQLRRDIEALAQVRQQLERDVAARAGELQQARGDAEGLRQELGSVRDRASALEARLASEQERTVLAQRELEQRDAANTAGSAAAAEAAELNRQIAQLSDQLRRLDVALGDRGDVRIVGDRFVFQSEVLFDSVTAEIGPEGREQLAKLAATLREIAAGIPSELPWVLQVDGHTDRRPINTARFPSNWELSTARAISVARFLVTQGIPSERVAATGFAEFQPLDEADNEEAWRRNRRIEIKLTTR